MATATQVSLYRSWKSRCIHLNPDSIISMKDLYQGYVTWMVNRGPNNGGNSIPIRPKTFATLIKKDYLSEELKDRVMFFYRDGSKVAGLRIDQQSSNNKSIE